MTLWLTISLAGTLVLCKSTLSSILLCTSLAFIISRMNLSVTVIAASTCNTNQIMVRPTFCCQYLMLECTSIILWQYPSSIRQSLYFFWIYTKVQCISFWTIFRLIRCCCVECYRSCMAIICIPSLTSTCKCYRKNFLLYAINGDYRCCFCWCHGCRTELMAIRHVNRKIFLLKLLGICCIICLCFRWQVRNCPYFFTFC